MRVRYSFSSRRTGQIKEGNKHSTPYSGIVKEVIRQSDLILNVLDARFIEESRNMELENDAVNHRKKIIFVLNKSDLIDKEKARERARKLDFPYVFISCREREGVAELREKIKIEASRMKIKDRKTRVGVVGYPNTGKSSVINILVGKSSARTAGESGFTKGMQKINLTEDIVILDTPGVIDELNSKKRGREAKYAEIGVKTFDRIKSPEMVVHKLMKKHPRIFEKYYNIDAGGDSEKLIEELGKRNNFLVKGGNIDVDRTARKILRDWQEGKIRV